MDDSAGDSACQLRLCHFESLGRVLFLAGCERRLDLLHERADSADSRMACGEFGPGRLPEPPAIIDKIGDLLK